jgi:hypothetical protein
MMLQLQHGHVPDLAIFYNGGNEIRIALGSGSADVHGYLGLFDIGAPDEPPNWVADLVATLNISRLVDRLKSSAESQSAPAKFMSPPPGLDLDTLADDLIDVYLGNYQLVAALAQRYGFEYHFFWQPALATTDKPLDPLEGRSLSTIDPRAIDFHRAIYERVATLSRQHTHLHYIADVLDQETGLMFYD